jgi:predicted ATPase
VLSRLFDAGWVLVATCNRTPEEFARSTMHREHPQACFTTGLLERCDCAHLAPGADDGTALDYRKTLRASQEPLFFSSLDHRSEQALEGSFARELRGGVAAKTTAMVGAGRYIELVGSAARGVARVPFKDVCDAPLGASDYIALAQQFHTLFLTDIPMLSLQERDQARRFITLIDQLYNHRAKLVASAAVPLEALFSGTSTNGVPDEGDLLEGLEFEGDAGKAAELNPIGVTANSLAEAAADGLSETARVGADTRKRLVNDSLFTGEDETFAFRRALSRLTEMQSSEYLGRAGASRPSAGVHMHV